MYSLLAVSGSNDGIQSIVQEVMNAYAADKKIRDMIKPEKLGEEM